MDGEEEADVDFVTAATTNSSPRRPPGKRRSPNIVRQQPGPSAAARQNLVNEVAFWGLFFTNEILQLIVSYTNRTIDRMTANVKKTHKDTHIKKTDLTEIRAFIRLMYLRGATKRNMTDVRDLFRHRSSPDIFQACMSYRRFFFLCHAISFDNFGARRARWKHGKFACFREIFELLNIRNAKMRIPSIYLAVGETFYPYRGATGIRTYNPSKPARYGLLIISLSDAEVPYTYMSLTYAGKPSDEPTEHYVKGDG